MTRETHKTNYNALERYMIRGELLNRFGRSAMSASYGMRASGSATRQGAVNSSSPLLVDRFPVIIPVKNVSGQDVPAYGCLAVDEIIEQYAQGSMRPQFCASYFAGRIPEGGYCTIAIMLHATSGGLVETVDAQVAAVCPALVRLSNVSHRRAYPYKDGTILQSGFAGPAKLIWVPDTTGDVLCLALLDGGQSVKLLGKTGPYGIDAARCIGDTIIPGVADVFLYETAHEPDKRRIPMVGADGQQLTQSTLNWSADAVEADRMVEISSDDDWDFSVIVESCSECGY